MTPEEFRRAGHELVDWIADFRATLESRPVMARTAPGDVARAFPKTPPETPQPVEAIVQTLDATIAPGLTHFGHPRFFGFFPTGGSLSSLLGDFASSGLGALGLTWQSAPALTEVEEVTTDWVRQMVGLSDAWRGVIQDTASTATLVALVCARERASDFALTREGLQGGGAPLVVYVSAQSHSSVLKAALIAGFGRTHVREIATDAAHALRPDALAAAMAEDRARGWTPCAVVATSGSTTCTAFDPIDAIAAICEPHRVWLHVDAAMAGSAMVLDECRPLWDGIERADSIVLNPHKWLFVPVDLSAFYCRRMDVVREAFSLVPEYLKTAEGTAGVRNLMDSGIQLGRRFRSLKLWMMLRQFGSTRLRGVLREHIRLAHEFAARVDEHPDFERLAPVPFATVCFRAKPRGITLTAPELDRLNERVLEAVNASGDVFLSHTRLNGAFAIRISIGHLRTTSAHPGRAWTLLVEHTAALARAP